MDALYELFTGVWAQNEFFSGKKNHTNKWFRVVNNIGVAEFTAYETSHRNQDHVLRLANIQLTALE